MKQAFTPEQRLTRWEIRRELQNIMGRLSQSYLMMDEATIYDRWWSKREDVCFGVNDGYYSGAEAVSGYYAALGRRIALASRLIAEKFPEKTSGKTEEELYGVGQIGIKPVDTFVIEIAEDMLSAKGIWSVHGTYVDITPQGPVSYWDWGYYCVDFIPEDGEWKIWHMQYLLDINSPTGDDWAKAPLTFPPEEAFAQMAEVPIPAPNVPCVLRKTYSPDRPFTESPPLPEPYASFAETFSYGM